MSLAPPIGLVPAAGHARRLGPMPVSKEVFPLGIEGTETKGDVRVRVPIDSLLQAFRAAGAETAYVVLREGKWDIPTYLGGGEAHDLSLAYLVTPPTSGVPFTIDQATPFVRESTVLFGFPDIVFSPQNVFLSLLRRLDDTGGDLVLGLFHARTPSKVDMVDVDDEGDVQSLVIKPSHTSLTYTWLIAAWTPTFTRFLHEEVQRRRGDSSVQAPETHFGHIIESAIGTDLSVSAVMLDDASYTDVGTVEALKSVLRRSNRSPTPAHDPFCSF